MKYNELLEEAKSCVGPGWWPTIEKYLPHMVKLAPEGEFFFKEKYGTLRMMVHNAYYNTAELIDLEVAAEQESKTICEECGQPGKLHPEFDWIQTLCDSCAAAKHRDIHLNDLVQDLIEKYGDIQSAYAEVCNSINPEQPDEEMLAVKQHLESLMIVDLMNEYG